MAGFFGKKLYAISPESRFVIKFPKERCRECSTWHMFFNSSLMVSMTDLFLSMILSFISIRQFFILLRILVTRCKPFTKRILVSSFERYPLSPYSFPFILSRNRSFLSGSLSSTLPWVMTKFKISPLSLTTRWSLNPKNQPTVDLPTVAVSLKTLFRLIRLVLQTLIGVESTNEIPVASPRQHVFRNRAMGSTAFCISFVKRL